MPKRGDFDTRPRKSVSTEIDSREFSSDGDVQVREHEREEGRVRVKSHARRKVLRARLSASQPQAEKSPSEEFMDNFDGHAREVDESLVTRTEENF